MEPLIDVKNMSTGHQHHFASLDVDRMMGGTGVNTLLSPSGNLSPNIMGRTAKFAVHSNQQLNKRESQQTSGDQKRPDTSSSTKMAENMHYMLSYEEPFA